MVRSWYSVMTYVHFELLLICVNKYIMREIRYKEGEGEGKRERESRDLFRGQKKDPLLMGP